MRRVRPRGPRAHARCAALCCCLTALSACGLRTAAFEAPAAAEVPDLRARWLSDPGDVRTALRLAAAHVASDAVDDARAVLASTHEVVPTDPLLTVVLGMTEHRLGRYLEADRHYRAFLEADPLSPWVPEVLARRYAVRPRVTRARAAQRVQGPAPSPAPDAAATIAVLPFAHDPADDDAAARSAALAELLSRDLERVGQPVVDPLEVRALLMELAVPPSRLRALGTAGRVGALTGASVVVYGALVQDPAAGWTIEAVMWTDRGDVHTLTDLSVDGVPGDLIAMEKRLAFLVLASRTDEIRISDSRLIAGRELTGTDALTAYGRGLLRSDEADHAGAAEAYTLAMSLDSVSPLAERRAERARVAAALESDPLGPALVSAARIGEARRASAAQRTRHEPTSPAAGEGLVAGTRRSISEVLGQDILGGGRLIELTFTLPGGER